MGLHDTLTGWRAWRARRQGAGRPGGTYHLVVPRDALAAHDEQARGLADCLVALGRRAILHPVKRLEDVGRLRAGDRVLALGPHRLAAFEPEPGVLYAAVNERPYPHSPGPAAAGAPGRRAGCLARCQVVCESHEALFEQARAAGLEPDGVLPCGYTSHWDWRAAPVKPRYDVAFIGDLDTDHRRELWEAVRTAFSTCPTTEAHGKARVRSLRAARIQLGLNRTEVPELDGRRFAMALANRCLLVNEPLPGGSPFVAGRHYVAASPASLIDVLGRLLERDDERRRIARAGHQFFRHEYRLETFVKRLLPVLDFAMEAEAAARRKDAPAG